MRSTKFWIIILLIVLIISASATLYIFSQETQGVVANIYQDGLCFHSIDLSQVNEVYTLQLEGEIINTIAVEPGRIRMLEATCPDQICVHQGWISNSVVPIVCLPNKLVIQIEAVASVDIDGLSQ